MLEIWTVYQHPKDFPEHFVARKFNYDQPTDITLVAERLENLRHILKRIRGGYLVNIGRNPEDDPAIVESWL